MKKKGQKTDWTSKFKRFARKYYIVYMLFLELMGSLVLAGHRYFFADRPFFKTLTESTIPFVCLLVNAIIGMYMFLILVGYEWRKQANEVFPIYKTIAMIIINAVIFLLLDPRERSYFAFLYDIWFWLLAILYAKWENWKFRNWHQ